MSKSSILSLVALPAIVLLLSVGGASAKDAAAIRGQVKKGLSPAVLASVHCKLSRTCIPQSKPKPSPCAPGRYCILPVR